MEPVAQGLNSQCSIDSTPSLVLTNEILSQRSDQCTSACDPKEENSARREACRTDCWDEPVVAAKNLTSDSSYPAVILGWIRQRLDKNNGLELSQVSGHGAPGLFVALQHLQEDRTMACWEALRKM